MTHAPTDPTDPLEAAFGIEELFFSRTDERGVIQSGNAVFQRVSGYGWEELIGSPHKLVRHADMPKAVFHLLWDTIKAGQPIGAYVKNRAKSGQYYWVFALVTPVEGGYLSVRLKPSSPLFDTVRSEYGKLRRAELEGKLSAADSAAALLGRLQELGWCSYGAFMADALVQEVNARAETLQGQVDQTGLMRRTVIEGATRNLADAREILTLCKKLKNSAVNLSIHSAKNAAHRQIFGVISENFARVSDRLKLQVEGFIDKAEVVNDQINTGLFLSATVSIQDEITQVFRAEQDRDSEFDQGREVKLLDRQSAEYADRAKASLGDMLARIRDFRWHCDEMLEHTGALGVTGSVGLIETARLDRGGAVAYDLLEETARIQHEIEAIIKKITQCNQALEQDVTVMSTAGPTPATGPAPAFALCS